MVSFKLLPGDQLENLVFSIFYPLLDCWNGDTHVGRQTSKDTGKLTEDSGKGVCKGASVKQIWQFKWVSQSINCKKEKRGVARKIQDCCPKLYLEEKYLPAAISTWVICTESVAGGKQIYVLLPYNVVVYSCSSLWKTGAKPWMAAVWVGRFSCPGSSHFP